MPHKPAESANVLVGAGCERAKGRPTAESGPAASFFGPEAWMPVEEVPLLACEGITWLSMDWYTKKELVHDRERENRVWELRAPVVEKESYNVSVLGSLEQCCPKTWHPAAR